MNELADAYNKYGEEYRAMYTDIFWTSWQKADSLYNKGKYKHAGLVKEAIPMRPDIDRVGRDGIRELIKTTSILKNKALNLVYLIVLEMLEDITASVLAYILLLR